MGLGLDHAFIMHFNELMCDMCDGLCEYIYIVNCIWNTKVRKHNLKRSENKHNMIVRELN